MTRSPKELIELYWGRVWNARETGLIREICADPIIRHDPMSVTPLSHEDQMARVGHQSASHPNFTHEVLLADDTYVCSVWNMFTRAGDPLHICGIEVFKAEDGRFTDCWNSSYSMTYWGRDVGVDYDALTPVPPRAPWSGQGEPPQVIRTPAELVQLYRSRVWTDGDLDVLREIVADPLARHEPGGLKYLGIGEQVAMLHADAAPEFSHEIILSDDTHVCSIWNMRSTQGPDISLSGIEVFRVENGRLVEHWAAPDTRGHWGRRGDAAVPQDLPRPALLGDVSEIDHVWMQSVFQHAGADVPRIAMVNIAPIGHGNLSNTVHARIGYNQVTTDVPTAVVAKFHSVLPDTQAGMANFSAYRTEIETYRLFGASPPIRVPRVYHAYVSDDGLAANLVFEDLGAFCEAGDQIAGCGPDEAAAVVHELARMHAHYWDHDGLKSFGWMAANRPANSDAADGYAVGAARFRERYADDLGAEDMAIIEGFVPLAASLLARRPEKPTLLHNDPRVDNIMFDRRTPGQVQAYILDWQVTGHGDPMHDIAYFLTGSLSPEDRRACERQLVAAHAVEMARVDPAYTPALALDAYCRHIWSGLHMTVLASTVMPDTPHNRALLTTLARRNCAAVRDWGGLAALQA